MGDLPDRPRGAAELLLHELDVPWVEMGAVAVAWIELRGGHGEDPPVLLGGLTSDRLSDDSRSDVGSSTMLPGRRPDWGGEAVARPDRGDQAAGRIGAARRLPARTE